MKPSTFTHYREGVSDWRARRLVAPLTGTPACPGADASASSAAARVVDGLPDEKLYAAKQAGRDRVAA